VPEAHNGAMPPGGCDPDQRSARRSPAWNPLIRLRGRSFGGTFTSLQEPEYAWYTAGSFSFFMAMSMQLLLRNFLAFDLTDSAVSLAVIAIAGGVVLLVLAPIGGTFADRLNKRTVLVTCEVLTTLLSLWITVMILTDLVRFWHLVLVSPILAGLFAFIMPARQALVPSLVPQHKLTNAVSLQMGGNTLTQIIAPALAGILIAPLGTGVVFAVTTVMFAVAAITDTRLPRYGMVANEEPKEFVKDFIDGFGYIRQHGTIGLLLVASLMMPLFAFPVQQMLPVFAKDVFGGGGATLGLLAAMVGVGGLVGALISANMDSQPRKGRLMMIGGATMATFMLAFTLSPWFILALVMLAGMGTGQMVYQATNNTAIQTMLTSEVRGRVMSVMMMSFGVMPLGVVPVALATDYIGPRFALGMAAVGLMLSLTTYFALAGRVRNLRIEQATESRLSEIQAAGLVAEGKLTREEAEQMLSEGASAGGS